MHPLIIEELAAERSRALHEQARRARLRAQVAGVGERSDRAAGPMVSVGRYPDGGASR